MCNNDTIAMLKDFIKIFLIIPDEEYVVEVAHTLFGKFSSTDILVYVLLLFAHS